MIQSLQFLFFKFSIQSTKNYLFLVDVLTWSTSNKNTTRFSKRRSGMCLFIQHRRLTYEQYRLFEVFSSIFNFKCVLKIEIYFPEVKILLYKSIYDILRIFRNKVVFSIFMLEKSCAARVFTVQYQINLVSNDLSNGTHLSRNVELIE